MIGEFVEGISVEVGSEVLKMVVVCPGFFRFGVQCLVGSVIRLR